MRRCPNFWLVVYSKKEKKKKGYLRWRWCKGREKRWSSRRKRPWWTVRTWVPLQWPPGGCRSGWPARCWWALQTGEGEKTRTEWRNRHQTDSRRCGESPTLWLGSPAPPLAPRAAGEVAAPLACVGCTSDSLRSRRDNVKHGARRSINN